MQELVNETATLGTFEAKAFFPVTDWERAESLCHNQLDEYRVDKKEFFKAPLNELKKVVRNVCDDYQPERYVGQTTDGMSKALFLKPASPAHPDLQIINCENCGEKLRVPNRTVKATCPHCDYTFQSAGVGAARAGVSAPRTESTPQNVEPEEILWFRDTDFLRAYGKWLLVMALLFIIILFISLQI
jgi:hypothetical protein